MRFLLTAALVGVALSQKNGKNAQQTTTVVSSNASSSQNQTTVTVSGKASGGKTAGKGKNGKGKNSPAPTPAADDETIVVEYQTTADQGFGNGPFTVVQQVQSPGFQQGPLNFQGQGFQNFQQGQGFQQGQFQQGPVDFQQGQANFQQGQDFQQAQSQQGPVNFQQGIYQQGGYQPGQVQGQQQVVIEVVGVDTSCRSAGVGALWCASKRKCLRAWEEPCPLYGPDDQTHVEVDKEVIQPTGSAVVDVPAARLYPTTPLVVNPPVYTQNPPVYTPYVPAQPANPALYNPFPPATPPVTSTGALYPPQAVAPLVYTATPATTTTPYVPATTTPYVPASTTPYVPVAPVPVPVPVPVAVPATPLYPAATTTTVVTTPAPYGSQRDAYGCVTGGGYSYCAALGRCVRPWETPCTAPATTTTVSLVTPAVVTPAVVTPVVVTPPVVTPPPPIGGQRDNGGCYTGAGYSFCSSLGRCVRLWETPCPA